MPAPGNASNHVSLDRASAKLAVAIFVSLLAALLGACEPHYLKRARVLEARGPTPANPTCVSLEECQVKWRAAHRRLSENISHKIKLDNGERMESTGTTPFIPALSVVVTKFKNDDGSYQIEAAFRCGWNSNCSEKATDVRRACTSERRRANFSLGRSANPGLGK